jgi:hypothetical protein
MIIEALERKLPPATLLLGPDPEQMVLAAHLAVRRHGSVQADRIVLRHMSAADARNLVNFAQTAPFGPFKAVIVMLDGSTPQSQNILLKVLEEPPPSIRFILVAAERPLPTIVSRCQVITVPGEGVQQEADGKVTAQVTAALNAAGAGDLNGLDAALKVWGDTHHSVLSLLLAEAAAGDSPHGISRPQARRLLGALGRYSGAHPRLAAHAALVTVLSDKEHHA